MVELTAGLALVLELAGLGAIALGAVVATAAVVRQAGRGARPGSYHAYRRDLSRGILLGLEFLVAADIVRTVTIDPSLHNLAVLGAIVAIRTFLSFTLEVETTGRWPWGTMDRASSGTS